MKINGEMHYLWRAVDQEGVDRRRVAIRLTAPPGSPWLPISYREPGGWRSSAAFEAVVPVCERALLAYSG